MSDITIFDQAAIRNENGMYSVYDTIEVLAKTNNPHTAWNRLTERHPEILAKTETLQLLNKAGRKGKATPTANKENLLYIIGLLPGAVGKSYREDAAKLMLAWLESPADLATKAIHKEKDLKKVEKHFEEVKLHKEYLGSYHGMHTELKEHGCDGRMHGAVNGHINKIVDVPVGGRETMTRKQRVQMMVAQGAAELALMDSEEQGWKAVAVVKETTSNILVSGYKDIPVFDFSN